ncbi:esterase-like activity of phytase family protein [Cyanobacterium sp. Dongsha4]|uniref:esterase-like activity of phytase family protein n=1 Tax=Cyanobacterium sp. DS4 TaxID=2878255 RepID=UPI002E7FF021|nr:esterase-like activity of phytase family protein [Cyanobacterium sp. Dongsha4]WVL01737.1 esterase-like activity of phytase family protein [Cyanobacterium sp. Dongsha4]
MSISRTRFIGFILVLFFFLFPFYDLKSLAEVDRTFLDLKIEFLGEYTLKEINYQDTVIGGLSGITYNPKEDVYYLISDDRANISPARFYTAKINIEEEKIENIKIENVTFLKDKKGELYQKNTTDTEGIAFSPRNSLFISSEGLTNKNIPAFINEYDLEGNLLNSIRIPERYIPKTGEKKGIENNLGLESLTIKANGFMPDDPFRLFTVTESALVQDVDLKNPLTVLRSRFLHYVINPFGDPVLIGEHLYTIDEPSFSTLYNGVADLLSLPDEGYLLSLERTFGLRGYGAKIFQLVIGNASDISGQKSISGNIENIIPIKKKLLLDLKQLGIKLDNLEGMTLGGRFPDGSQSLILVSDNNFSGNSKQKNQFLLFKISK